MLSVVPEATLTIISRNYGSWSLRGWLLCRFAGLDVKVVELPREDASARAELLHLSPSFLTPRLEHGDVTVWDTLAIAEYLDEIRPEAHLWPEERVARAHCRSVSGEMHSGFASMRGALPMNIKARFKGFKVWSRAQADIDRVVAIWRECLGTYGGPFLFGKQPGLADAMYAPVVTRFLSYDVALDSLCAAYCKRVMELPAMQEWVQAALKEPDEIDELDAEF